MPSATPPSTTRSSTGPTWSTSTRRPPRCIANAAVWFWDQEIFDYIGQHLNLIDRDKLSARTYVKAYERRQKGDWREFLERRYFSQAAEQWVVALENDPRFRTVAEKVAEFERRTGLQRSHVLQREEATQGRRATGNRAGAVLHAQRPRAESPTSKPKSAASRRKSDWPNSSDWPRQSERP